MGKHVGGEHSLEEYTGVERSGGNFPGGNLPRTDKSEEILLTGKTKFDEKDVMKLFSKTFEEIEIFRNWFNT